MISRITGCFSGSYQCPLCRWSRDGISTVDPQFLRYYFLHLSTPLGFIDSPRRRVVIWIYDLVLSQQLPYIGILYNFGLGSVNEVPISFLVDSTATRLHLHHVALIYDLLNIVENAQQHTDSTGNAFRINLCT